MNGKRKMKDKKFDTNKYNLLVGYYSSFLFFFFTLAYSRPAKDKIKKRKRKEKFVGNLLFNWLGVTLVRKIEIKNERKKPNETKRYLKLKLS